MAASPPPLPSSPADHLFLDEHERDQLRLLALLLRQQLPLPPAA